MTGRHSLELDGTPGSVSTAREFVRLVLASSRIDGTAADTAVLLTSELVTNAARHSPDGCRVTVDADGTHVTIEVEDHDRDHAPVLRHAGPWAESGRGLDLVNRLATRWGCIATSTGKVVWFSVLTQRS